MDKILILGGTGNIGFPLIKELQKQNVSIRVGLHNIKNEAKRFWGFKNIETIHFDFLNPKTFDSALSGINKVFMVRPPQLADPKNDMFPFLRAVKDDNVNQIVFVSLIGVDKNPVVPHHKIEKEIVKLQIPHTFIRPSFFMQNLNTTHLQDIRDNHDLFIPAGNSKTSFIDTRDIAAVAAKSLTDPKYLNKALEITGEKALTYQEISKIMTDELGKKITYSKPSLLKFRKVMLKRGIKKDYVNVMVMLYLITQLGNAKKVTNTVKEVLGRPATSFAQYVKDYRDIFLGKSK